MDIGATTSGIMTVCSQYFDRFSDRYIGISLKIISLRIGEESKIPIGLGKSYDGHTRLALQLSAPKDG